MMNKAKKKEYIKEMTTYFDKSEAVIVAHYQGLTVSQLDKLRKEMRQHGIIFKITKNSKYFACTCFKNRYFSARKIKKTKLRTNQWLI